MSDVAHRGVGAHGSELAPSYSIVGLRHAQLQGANTCWVRSHRPTGSRSSSREAGGRKSMNIFYIIGVVVVVLFVLGYLGFR
jgi:hypothetical protein